MKEIQAVLIRPKACKAEKVSFKPSLQEYYRLLECELIEYAHRTVFGQEVCIVCDEEGLFDGTNVASAVNNDGKIMFVGNILVIGAENENGHDTGLSDEIADIVLRNVATVGMVGKKDELQVIKVLTNVGY